MLFLLAACDSTDADDDGSFKAEVTGAIERDISGTALYGTRNFNNEILFFLNLQASDGEEVFDIYVDRNTNLLPTERSYTVVGNLDEIKQPTQVAVFVQSKTDGSQTWSEWTGESGIIRITQSTPNDLQGTFDFTVEGTNSRTLSLTGTFAARRGI